MQNLAGYELAKMNIGACFANRVVWKIQNADQVCELHALFTSRTVQNKHEWQREKVPEEVPAVRVLLAGTVFDAIANSDRVLAVWLLIRFY